MPERFPGFGQPPIHRPAEEGVGEWEHDDQQPTTPAERLALFKRQLAMTDKGSDTLAVLRASLFRGGHPAEHMPEMKRATENAYHLLEALRSEDIKRARDIALELQAESGLLVKNIMHPVGGQASADLLGSLLGALHKGQSAEFAETAALVRGSLVRALSDHGIALDALMTESSSDDGRGLFLSLTKLIRNAMRSGDEESASRFLAILEKHRGMFMTFLREYSGLVDSLAEPLLIVGTDEQRKAVREMLIKSDPFASEQKAGDHGDWKTWADGIGSLLASDFAQPGFLVKEMLLSHLTQLGFADSPRAREMSGYDLIHAWRQSAPADQLGHVVYRNMAMMYELERNQPGSAKVLADTFGIADFARYPFPLLLRQYENRENDERPYGIVLFPEFDHNGAFYEDAGQLAQLQASLGSGYDLRVVECGSKLEIFRTLRRLDERYGGKNKISFAVIGGHGVPERIQFGPDGRAVDFLSITDLSRGGARSARGFFKEETTLILVSCSTGAPGGIGQRFSKEPGVTVFAPIAPTNIQYMRASEDAAKKLRFQVVYRSKDPTDSLTQRFEKGLPA